MSKKVFVITSSLRQGSNSDMLAQAFAERRARRVTLWKRFL